MNLYLHVGSKRTDGYHDIDSLCTFTTAFNAMDSLRFQSQDTLELSIIPEAVDLGITDDNLIIKAAKILSEFGLNKVQTGSNSIQKGAKITLKKVLPLAAGLGGGSANAAATLRGLNRLWNMGLEQNQLYELASCLGADTPACLQSEPVFMHGIGQDLWPASDLPSLPALLVNPNLPCPTKDVYHRFDVQSNIEPLGRIVSSDLPTQLDPLLDWLALQRNDLQTAAIALCPPIGDSLAELSQLPNVRLVRMSGSGASLFALFTKLSHAQSAATQLRITHPDWWVEVSLLGGLSDVV